MELLRPTLDMEQQYYDFIAEWEKQGEDITPYSIRLLDMDYKAWLEYTLNIERQETCPSHLVTAHTYLLVDLGGRVIGAINIRHYLNDYLLNYGGHIGYGIRQSERRKGYATLMLSMALPIAKSLGIDRVLITCNKGNEGSAKTIIKNGGVLENEVEKDGDGDIIQRYWIEL